VDLIPPLIQTVFEKAPGLTTTDDWGQLLPWNLAA
jgi:hypothetical protein